jgi:heme exporter protein C
VGSAWAGALGFFVAVGMAIAYLITRKPIFDRLEHASVEVGLALVTIGLVGGMVWGDAVWGTPWTWDPKLTGFAVMWLSYAAYLMLREGIEEPERRARFAAIYAIVAVVSVVFTYLGVRVIEATIHPYVVGEAASTSSSDFGLSQRMTNTLLFNIFSWSLIYATLFWHRLRLRSKSDRLDELKTRYFLQQAGD